MSRLNKLTCLARKCNATTPSALRDEIFERFDEVITLGEAAAIVRRAKTRKHHYIGGEVRFYALLACLAATFAGLWLFKQSDPDCFMMWFTAVAGGIVSFQR